MLPEYPSETECDELINAQGLVYALEYDADYPGGSGAFFVYPWKDQFVVVSEMGDETVYGSVRDAVVDGGINYVTSATTAVESSALSAEALASLLTTFDDGHHQVEINGEPWETGPALADGARSFVRSAHTPTSG